MRLRIVEFADELQDYKYLEDEKIIALNPCSQSFLKKRKIKFENSLNFFGTEGHLSILRQSKKIMDNVKKFNNFYDKNNLSKSYTEGLDNYLTFYVRYMLILLYIVDKAIKKPMFPASGRAPSKYVDSSFTLSEICANDIIVVAATTVKNVKNFFIFCLGLVNNVQM